MTNKNKTVKIEIPVIRDRQGNVVCTNEEECCLFFEDLHANDTCTYDPYCRFEVDLKGKMKKKLWVQEIFSPINPSKCPIIQELITNCEE